MMDAINAELARTAFQKKAVSRLPAEEGLDLSARADAGKPGTTLVTMNAAGERLGPAMAEFAAELRRRRKA